VGPDQGIVDAEIVPFDADPVAGKSSVDRTPNADDSLPDGPFRQGRALIRRVGVLWRFQCDNKLRLSLSPIIELNFYNSVELLSICSELLFLGR